MQCTVVVVIADDSSLMQALVIYCHPIEGSFCSAMRDAAVNGLQRAGHEVAVIDLAADEFDPVMSHEEWITYNAGQGVIPDGLEHYVTMLRKAEIIVFVYPTYWSGMPAQLKGWLERVFVRGVAFKLNKKNKVRPALQYVKHICVISTFGSPYMYIKFVNDNGRRIITRALRISIGLRTRVSRFGLYAMDKATHDDRQKFLLRIEKSMAKL
jgi:NAD(P)H dehydrogenase (quinone)